MSGLRLQAAMALVALMPMGLAACGGDDSPRRAIAITQTDAGCTPESLEVTAGEKIRFEVTNQASKDYELEGIEGTKLEETLIPHGKTRNVNFTAPANAGTGKLKCYVPSGSATVIELKVK